MKSRRFLIYFFEAGVLFKTLLLGKAGRLNLSIKRPAKTGCVVCPEVKTAGCRRSAPVLLVPAQYAGADCICRCDRYGWRNRF